MEIISHAVGRNAKNSTPDVMKIQQLLKGNSVISNMTVNGRFDADTLKAIVLYQMSVSLHPKDWDGRIAPNGKTLRELNNAKTPILKKNISAAMVDAQIARFKKHGISKEERNKALERVKNIVIVRDEVKTLISSYSGPSGKDWYREFPTGKSLDDLRSPFRENFKKFWAAVEAALKNAGVKVPPLTATYRPSQRAHLMFYAYVISEEGYDPRKVPKLAGVNIDWVHKGKNGVYDVQASEAAAEAMSTAYDIDYRPAEPAKKSLHISGNAVDVKFSWNKPILIDDGYGHTITIPPGDSVHSNELHEVAATYDVIKNVDDKPHWSINGG